MQADEFSIREDGQVRERLMHIGTSLLALHKLVVSDLVAGEEVGLRFPDTLKLSGQLDAFSALWSAITRDLYGDAEEQNLRRLTGMEGE